MGRICGLDTPFPLVFEPFYMPTKNKVSFCSLSLSLSLSVCLLLPLALISFPPPSLPPSLPLVIFIIIIANNMFIIFVIYLFGTDLGRHQVNCQLLERTIMMQLFLSLFFSFFFLSTLVSRCKLFLLLGLKTLLPMKHVLIVKLSTV